MNVTIEQLHAESPLLETVLGSHWHEWSNNHADANLAAWRDHLRVRSGVAGVAGVAGIAGIPFTLIAFVDDAPAGCVTVRDDDADERFAERGP